MGEAIVSRKIQASAEAVWDRLSWRGMAQSAGDGVFAAVTFEDDRDAPGSKKVIQLRNGARLCERLEWLDSDAKAYGYRVLDGGDLPIASYEGIVRVTAMGPDACAVVIRCSFVGVTVADEAYSEEWRAMETELLNQLAMSAEIHAPA